MTDSDIRGELARLRVLAQDVRSYVRTARALQATATTQRGQNAIEIAHTLAAELEDGLNGLLDRLADRTRA